MSASGNDMTFAELVALLQRLVQNLGGTYKQDVIEDVVQMIAVPQIARRHHWRGITKPYTQTMTVGTDSYVLPYDFDKFLFVKHKYNCFGS